MTLFLAAALFLAQLPGHAETTHVKQRPSHGATKNQTPPQDAFKATTTPAAVTSSKQDSAEGKAPPQDNASYEHESMIHQRHLVRWTVILALVTIVVAGTGIFQYRAFRQSSERQLRAYICAKKGKLDWATDAHEEILGTEHTFVNAGQTPAYQVCVAIYAELRENLATRFEDLATPQQAQVLL